MKNWTLCPYCEDILDKHHVLTREHRLAVERAEMEEQGLKLIAINAEGPRLGADYAFDLTIGLLEAFVAIGCAVRSAVEFEGLPVGPEGIWAPMGHHVQRYYVDDWAAVLGRACFDGEDRTRKQWIDVMDVTKCRAYQIQKMPELQAAYAVARDAGVGQNALVVMLIKAADAALGSNE